MATALRGQRQEQSKATTIDEAAKQFFEELSSHHFGCEGPDQKTIVGAGCRDSNNGKTCEAVGTQFVSDLLRRFHNDRSFLEDDHPSEAA